VRERIGVVRIDPLLRHEDVRPVARDELRHHSIEGAQVRRVVGERGEGDVDAVARTLAAAAFVGEARAGEERTPALVQADRQDLVALVERRLHAVTVMCVDVDVRDTHPAIGEQAADDRGIVVDAETRRATPHRMVQPARVVDGHARAAGEHVLHRRERAAGGEEADLMHPFERRRVAVRVEAVFGVVHVRIGRRLHHRLDVLRRVDALDLVARRRARRQHVRARSVERAETRERVADPDEPFRTERMSVSIHVRGDARGPDEARTRAEAHRRMRSSVRKLKA